VITFTQSVGVAPGTTTMNLGDTRGELVCLGEPCPPDPVRPYTPIARGAAPKPGAQLIYNPYATEARLNGLAGLHGARLGVGVLAAVAAFGLTIAYGYFRGRR